MSFLLDVEAAVTASHQVAIFFSACRAGLVNSGWSEAQKSSFPSQAVCPIYLTLLTSPSHQIQEGKQLKGVLSQESPFPATGVLRKYILSCQKGHP